MIFRKYEFTTKEEALEKINTLGIDEEGNPTHNHSIAKLGNIVLQQGEYDADGNETVAPVISEKYHIDVLWSDAEPTEWQPYQVWCEPVGVHIFGNSAAVKEWTERCKELHPEFFPEPEIEL